MARRTAGKLTAYVLDVGQGDSTVIVGPGEGEARKVLLIDGGPAGSGTEIRQFFADMGLHHVDYAVLTHFDADHVGGFVTIRGNTPVFWSSAGCTKTEFFPTAAIYEHFTDTFNTASAREWDKCVSPFAHRVRVTQGTGLGNSMELGGGYSAKILAGDGYVLGHDGRIPSATTENSRSVAVLVSGPGGFDFLIPGDATGQPGGAEKAEVEVAIGEYLTSNSIDLEVLRVGHHGAENTSNPTFIGAAKPEVAIVSVGDQQPSNFKHPRCKTYKTLAEKRVAYVLQTEAGKPDCETPSPAPIVANGTIRIDVVGGEYTISSQAPGTGNGTLTPLGLRCTLTGCMATGGGIAGPSSAAEGSASECCKVCRTSKPCGDACIPNAANCTKPKGCACAGQ